MVSELASSTRHVLSQVPSRDPWAVESNQGIFALFQLPFVPVIRCFLYFFLKESRDVLTLISAGIELHVLSPAYVIQFCDTSSLL